MAGLPEKEYTWQFLDRGAVNAYVEQRNAVAGVPKTSGPYSLVAGQVYRADGEYLYSEPGFSSTYASGGYDDLFGSQLVYSRMSTADRAEVWVVNVTKANPRRINVQSCSKQPLVAVWGDLAAWQRCGENGFTVRDLNTNLNRKIIVGSGDGGALTQLTLREGTISWLNAGVAATLDLRAAKATVKPVVMKEGVAALAVDDHRMAVLRDAAGGGAVEVLALPFDRKYRPRLIGMLGPRGFSPNGDSNGETWTPEFDVTKNMTTVTLRIKALKSGKTVRTLKASGADGSIRNLSWNGRSGKGKKLGVGTYRWQLTGVAKDGDGA